MIFLYQFPKKDLSLLNSSRLVFENGVPEAPVVQPVGPQNPEDQEVVSLNDRGAVLQASEEQRAELQESVKAQLDPMGEAKDYIDLFNDPREVEKLMTAIEFGKLAPNSQGDADFELWPLAAEQTPEQFLQSMTMLPLPHGKGRNAFLNGFDRAAPNYEVQHKASMETLPKIIILLKANREKRRESGEDLEAVSKKDPILGTTLGEIKGNLLKSYQRAGGLEKGAMIASAAVIIWYLWNKKDEAMPGPLKDLKYSTAFKWIGGFMALNYLVGKGSKDGRTLAQKALDIKPSLDSIEHKDNAVRAFGENHGMMENESKFTTMMHIRDTNVSQLYAAYYQEKLHGDSDKAPSIPPEALGLSPNLFDGELAYDIIDDLVRDTAIAKFTKDEYDRRDVAAQTGQPYTPRSDDEILADATQDANMLPAFEDKYINTGSIFCGSTLQKAITNEYPPGFAQKVVSMHEANRKIPGVMVKMKNEWVGKGRRLYEKHMADKVAEGKQYIHAFGTWIGEKYEVVKDEYVIPAWKRTKGLTKRHVIDPVADFEKRREVKNDQAELNKILPADFAVTVTEPGVATVLGYPGLPFKAYTNEDGKYVATIDGSTDIEVDKGLADPANIAIFNAIETKIKSKVEGLVKNDIAHRNAVRLQGKTVEWDSAEKKWMIQDVNFEAHPILPKLGHVRTNLSAQVDADGKKLHYYILGHEVTDFNKLDEEYANAEIEDTIWNGKINGSNPASQEYLEGLPVKVESVTKTANGPLIKGTIGGLTFRATLTDPTDFEKGFDFIDSTGKFDAAHKGGFDKIEITGTNGGNEFIARLADKVDESKYVSDAFDAAQGVMDNASEGVLQRLGAAASGGTKLWIIPIPTEGDKLINGNILHNQWKNTLSFKRTETKDFFVRELRQPGKTVKDVADAYTHVIKDSVSQIEQLTVWTAALSPEDKSKQFVRLLSGQRNPADPMPAGLEYVNYHDQTYGKLFKKYQDMITKFDFEGIDKSDLPVFTNSYYEAYTRLLQIWSFHTRKYRNGPVDAAKEAEIETKVIDEVQKKLHAATLNGKAIKVADLPRSEDEIEKWLPDKVN